MRKGTLVNTMSQRDLNALDKGAYQILTDDSPVACVFELMGGIAF
jgi:hypothetical protein